MPPTQRDVLEPFGERVAFLRVGAGLTQRRLAERVAMSRGGLSHLESGLATASERTVTLLAGVFGLEPYELVEGTDYPTARAERLPLVAARYTRVDFELAALDADLRWCDRIGDTAVTTSTREHWRSRLEVLAGSTFDVVERERLEDARRQLNRPVDPRCDCTRT